MALNTCCRYALITEKYLYILLYIFYILYIFIYLKEIVTGKFHFSCHAWFGGVGILLAGIISIFSLMPLVNQQNKFRKSLFSQILNFSKFLRTPFLQSTSVEPLLYKSARSMMREKISLHGKVN